LVRTFPKQIGISWYSALRLSGYPPPSFTLQYEPVSTLLLKQAQRFINENIEVITLQIVI
ncbi:hypothetical protein QOL56_16790, partial [Klebsiella quasipneumoniae]